MSKFAEALRAFYTREIPRDEAVWHRRNLFFPARTIEGRWCAAVWRRRRNGRWEYSEHVESAEDREARLW